MDVFEEYRQRREKIKQMGGAKAVEQQHQRGKWSARERIDYFFDPGTFTEIGLFVKHRTAAFGMDRRRYLRRGLSLALGR